MCKLFRGKEIKQASSYRGWRGSVTINGMARAGLIGKVTSEQRSSGRPRQSAMWGEHVKQSEQQDMAL